MWTGITGGFGWTSLLSGNLSLSWPTDDHWRWWTSQIEAPGNKRFAVTHLATKESSQVVPDIHQTKKPSENSCTKLRGFCAMTTTSRFWSNLSLVFMIDLLQHYLKGFMQPCLRVNHGNYQEQKSFPQWCKYAPTGNGVTWEKSLELCWTSKMFLQDHSNAPFLWLSS